MIPNILAGQLLKFCLSLLPPVPTHPPINLTLFNTSSTTIQVNWKPIPSEHLNGVLKGYHVIFRQADNPTANVTVLTVDNTTISTKLSNLTKYRKYLVSVFGFNAAGDGNVSEGFTWTDQDGK